METLDGPAGEHNIYMPTIKAVLGGSTEEQSIAVSTCMESLDG